MSELVLSNDAITRINEAVRTAGWGGVNPSQWKVGLFTNEIVLSNNTTLAQLTQPNFLDYGLRDVNLNLWPASTVTANYAESIAPAPVVWVNDGVEPITVRGVFVVLQSTPGVLWGSLNFDLPITRQVEGEFRVTPRWRTGTWCVCEGGQ